MKNKYIILSAVYRFDKNDNATTPKSKLEKTYLSYNIENNNLSKEMIKNTLKDIYGINDNKSAIEVLNYYTSEEVIYNIGCKIFIDIYLENKDNIESLTTGQIKKLYLNEKYLRHIFNAMIPSFFYRDENYPLDNYENYIESLISNMQKKVLSIFNNKSGKLTPLLEFFKKNEILIPYAEKVGFQAYNISIAVDIIGMAFSVGYLDEEFTEYYATSIGYHTETIFGDWETFLASAILGKLYVMTKSSKTAYKIETSDKYIDNIYGLLTSTSNPLNICEFWKKSNLKSFSKDFQLFLEKTKFNKITGTIDLKERTNSNELIIKNKTTKISAPLKEGKELKSNTPSNESKQVKPDTPSNESKQVKLDTPSNESKQVKSDVPLKTSKLKKPRETRAIELFKFLMGDDITKLGFDFLFYMPNYAKNIYFPVENIKDVQEFFWYKIDSTGIEFHPDEIPFLYSKKVVFTNKSIYKYNKRIFSKTSFEVITWDSNPKFELKKCYLDTYLFLNGDKVGYLSEAHHENHPTVKKFNKLDIYSANEVITELLKDAIKIFNKIPEKIKKYESMNNKNKNDENTKVI